MLEATSPETGALTGSTIALEDKFITLSDGVQVCYQEAGPPDAPAVFLTHGFLGSLRDWRFTTGPLAALAQTEGHPLRVIALDWVGFGRSSKPVVTYSLFYFADFLKKFAEALGLQRFHLIGHSAGGKHNLAFNILYPEYVEKMVLVDTDGFIKDPWWTHQTKKKWFKPLGDLSTELLGKEWFLKAALKNILYDRQFYPTVAEITTAAEELRDPEYKAALRSLNRDYPQLSLKLTGLRERIGEIKGPVQIFWGLQDRILRLDQAHVAQAEIPNSQLFVFDHCGHLPQVEKAPEFNQRVLEFVLK